MGSPPHTHRESALQRWRAAREQRPQSPPPGHERYKGLVWDKAPHSESGRRGPGRVWAQGRNGEVPYFGGRLSSRKGDFAVTACGSRGLPTHLLQASCSADRKAELSALSKA
jgi:hypothetical protein